ncbi:zinc finger CCCH domain-containing protein 11A-like isoform X2 [Anthonomus grandis grandis]|nr:zinc finger CCCH domain-containing protein 11A-like isoform X2 [Anthonomus grandis grandis]
MTDLESPKKNNDCYFYYYSTCSKGDSCAFRHEPSALGCETMCSFWKEGKCLNVHCNFRHMELRKNRKAIPCYWESQPVGCLKPHCPFMHQVASQRSEGPNDALNKSENMIPENCTQASTFKSTSSVDSLVVNFEEESDNESGTSPSPVKIGDSNAKTLEEIKLEKIAEAGAAYYSYHDHTQTDYQMELDEDDLRQRLLKRVRHSEMPRKLSRLELSRILGDKSLEVSHTDSFAKSQEPYPFKRQKMESPCEIKIKTLEEIRLEKIRKKQEKETAEVPMILNDAQKNEEAVVSSTSNDEPETTNSLKTITVPMKPLRKLNLKKIKAKFAKSKTPIDHQSTHSKVKLEDLCTDLPTPSAMSVTSDVPSSSKDDTLTSNANIMNISPTVSVKGIDESLLLLDDVDDEVNNLNLKSEEDLLREIDNYLSD